jgi:mycothiol synthase
MTQTFAGEIRQLAAEDIPFLESLLQRALEFDRCPLPTLLHKTLESGDTDLGLVAVEGDRILGLIQAGMGRGKHSTTGFIRLIAVDHCHRNRGVGGALLAEAEKRMAAVGATTFSTGDCPHNYFQPGIDFRSTETHCFFWKHGYEFFRENHNLIAPLPPPNHRDLEQEIAEIAKHGFEVRLATTADFPACEVFLAANWEPWIVEARHALEQEQGGLWLAYEGSEVVGFSAYGGNNIGLPWFGPMGTKPGMRGKGLGSLLLRLCLRGLYDLGYGSAVIPWVGPIRFYARACGARIDRSFWVHHKQVQ